MCAINTTLTRYNLKNTRYFLKNTRYFLKNTRYFLKNTRYYFEINIYLFVDKEETSSISIYGSPLSSVYETPISSPNYYATPRTSSVSPWSSPQSSIKSNGFAVPQRGDVAVILPNLPLG